MASLGTSLLATDEMCIRDRAIVNPDAPQTVVLSVDGCALGMQVRTRPVSYTHLDVYKRQRMVILVLLSHLTRGSRPLSARILQRQPADLLRQRKHNMDCLLYTS